MADPLSHIPTEATLPILGTIDIHWNYHALLMVGIWLIWVPICITIIRYGKPKPTELGLQRKVSFWHPEWWWFSAHKYGLYGAVAVALAGLVVAMVVRGGVSGSVHATFGILTMFMAIVQVIFGMLRGSHGGKFYNNADPDDPATWHGDHYSRTNRRRFFEAYHRTAGYFVVFCATGAVASGLMQYPMPLLARIVIVIPFFFLAFWIVMEFLERRYDGYRAVHGYGMEHPYNKEREFL